MTAAELTPEHVAHLANLRPGHARAHPYVPHGRLLDRRGCRAGPRSGRAGHAVRTGRRRRWDAPRGVRRGHGAALAILDRWLGGAQRRGGRAAGSRSAA